jgi:hypothetical protein
LYGTETWTLRKVDQKYLETSEAWCSGRMEKISLTDRVKNKVLNIVKEKKNRTFSKKEGKLTELVTPCVGTAF